MLALSRAEEQNEEGDRSGMKLSLISHLEAITTELYEVPGD